MYKILKEDPKTKARIGKLKTRHAAAETPFFMPVATKASVKLITSDELKEMGAKAIICNSLVLFLRPGLEIIKKAHGLHKFMNFNDVIFTDSGGFQTADKSFAPVITNNGVLFKSPFDGVPHLITPEKAANIQEELGSDVAMVLDDMPPYGKSKDYVIESLKRTHDWASRFKNFHKDSKQLVFGITQGGTFKDLRKISCELISKLDFDGIALGGLSIGEPKKLMYGMIDYSERFLPKDTPRYLMGVGSPEDIIDCVSHGIDVFDSCMPTRNARHGTLFTSNGKVLIENREYKEDFRPLDKNCDCYVCKNHTRAYLNYLIRMKEPTGLRLVSYHNVYFVQNLMKEIRTAIKENGFEKFRKEFLKGYLKKK
ncbi:MAG: tRNA guanosine(34) transglycosylase Tgt [Candidatus Woesearchaeota archaeon]|nr:tRNA guanosine(34) transglycosylase Tgt [Candidatus Woesearchaeota archaeon]